MVMRVLGRSVKSLLALMRKELTDCGRFFATQNDGVVSGFPSTIRFTFSYVR